MILTRLERHVVALLYFRVMSHRYQQFLGSTINQVLPVALNCRSPVQAQGLFHVPILFQLPTQLQLPKFQGRLNENGTSIKIKPLHHPTFPAHTYHITLGALHKGRLRFYGG